MIDRLHVAITTTTVMIDVVVVTMKDRYGEPERGE
jgi:hypothetical protein